MVRSVLKGSFPGVLSRSLGKLLLAGILLIFTQALQAKSQPLIEKYIDEWKSFYPSSAFGEGDKSAAWRFEDFSTQRVSDWLSFNHKTKERLSALPANAPLNDRIDAKVLLRQVRLELELWEHDKPLTQQPQWYAGKISEALTYVLVSEKLSPAEKYKAVTTRLAGVDAICRLGIDNLKNGNPGRTRGALKSLQKTIGFYENKLLAQSDSWNKEGNADALFKAVNQATLRKIGRAHV